MRIVTAVLLASILALTSNLSLARANHAPALIQTRDAWRSVVTNNLLVIGNTDPETLRQVAGWLEFFHAGFAQLISRSLVSSNIPTRVVVFRDEASFSQFAPLYQGKPVSLSGYFQPGEHVNHIVFFLDGNQRQPYATAFHEYVHLHLRQNVAAAPLWLNEGLAELYSNLQFSSNEAVIGAPIGPYLRLLRASEILPLSTLFSIGFDSPHYNEQEKTGIFYGQSWALVHYLMMGGGRQRHDQFKHFLQLVSRGERADKALESAYGTTLEALESELKNYLRQGQFNVQRLRLADSSSVYSSYTAMQRSSLTEAEANYYLGELLQNSGRQSDALRYFEKAVALEPNYAPANAALGSLLVEQRRYDEAKRFLERAVASPQNYLVHYLYAYTLSREELNSPGRRVFPENSNKIRAHIKRAIGLSPNFAPAYYLLAVVNFVSDEQLDEAESMATKAHQLAPSKTSYALLLARIHLHRGNFELARQLLEPLTRQSDAAVKNQAQELLERSQQTGVADRSRRTRNQSGSTQMNSEITVEPETPTTSRGILEGMSTTTVIRDGQTIDNSAQVPALDEVLDKYAQAMGGAAIDAVTSRLSQGTLEIVGVSRNGTFEIYEQAPDKSLTVTNAHPRGTVKVAYNGKTGWIQSTAGAQILKGPELAALQMQSSFYGHIKLKTLYSQVKLLGKSKIGFREVFVLELEPHTGPLEKLFLDAESYLPVRANGVRIVHGQRMVVEIYFDDWREVGGIKLPFHLTVSSRGQGMAFTVKAIKHNLPMDASLFDPPVK